MLEKACCLCKQVKSADNFSKRLRNADGLRSECKQCGNSRNKTYTNADKEKLRKLKSLFNLSEDDYNAMLSHANNACEICHGTTGHLCVDHNHSNGKVRGILCTTCNFGIGHLEDNPAIIASAIDYLNKHQSVADEKQTDKPFKFVYCGQCNSKMSSNPRKYNNATGICVSCENQDIINQVKARLSPGAIRSIQNKYNLTPKEYFEIGESQAWCCAICHKSQKLVVDHCHKSKQVRGLLCNSCNSGIGYFREQPKLLQYAIEYLKERNDYATLVPTSLSYPLQPT